MPPPEYLSSSVEVFRRSSVQESLNSIHVTCEIASVAETHGNAQMFPPRTIAPRDGELTRRNSVCLRTIL